MRAHPVGKGEHVVYATPVLDGKELAEPAGGGEAPALLQERETATMAVDEPLVGPLVTLRAAELHAVLLTIALDLAMTEHRQAWERGQKRRRAKVFIMATELIHGRSLVGVAHEVDVAPEDAVIERDRLTQDLLVLGVLLIAQHVHEGAVVDAVDAEGAREIALHQPERLGQEQRVGDLGCDAVHDLSPELLGHESPELGCRGLKPQRCVTGCPPGAPAGDATGAGCDDGPGPSRHRSGSHGNDGPPRGSAR